MIIPVAAIINLTITAVVSYLIGSIPTGYIAVKKIKGIDIRTVGSGSTGATNVKRVLGTKWFYIVMFLDALKGFLPVLSTKLFFNLTIIYLTVNYIECDGISQVIAAIFVIIGHSKSCFLGFTGGKSVATGVGTILAINPLTGLSVAAIWGIITYVSKYVSLGSVIAMSLSPIIMFAFTGNFYYTWFAALGAAFVVYRHKDNIKRLFDGTENKVRK